MHVGAVSVAATPVAGGGRQGGTFGVTTIGFTASAFVYRPAGSPLWYTSENVDIEVEFEGIAIEAEQHIGVTTE